MKYTLTLIATSMALLVKVDAFAPQQTSISVPAAQTCAQASSSVLCMANDGNDSDLMRWAKASRSAEADDNVVELMRPLGLVLNEDKQGNVFVETVAPKGNAARTGKVKEGDLVTMCSATFGDQMWSTRGVGLTRVLAAIRVRAGPTVKIVVETPKQYQKKASFTSKQREAADNARLAAQAKKDALLNELEKDEKKLRKGKFLGLF
uniref:PDZ domain-containing protein n=1 Tax=Craspedostauros australis TaxID=1486917 RepID=A0A7R9WQP4_9STRA|mmetsp:Transcript_15837/g.43708  ORF Transcript_15837/g.43708 Transcript_15837/m.43708 type:complete len:206 (+) Transcript_15837:276-893(+)|eukprot:CAMPEP_0198122318 /NCGR_PEP_ID=MMETSP1442-20131203/34463_1 /TAXON_ID= /ORGANISM="Craspedostauros australis, Strain CCMP3328" /LENGTH=205 /DNA_ID=CAMNT_0043781311 /DNA_START=221 /DNA_END=838 /DNA_ORIENTATION=+